MARAKRKDAKGRVLKVGESQDKNGRYCYRWTDALGKRNTIYSLNLAELREKEKQIQRDIEDGISTGGGNLTLNQLFELYMKTRVSIRESSRCNYENFWTISVKSSLIGELKISQIKQIHIKRLYVELKEKGIKNSTLQSCHVLISAVFQLAVDSDYIRRNPCRNCRKEIKAEPSHRQALSISEQKNMLDFVKESNVYNVYWPILNFALSTGLRIGEIIGLRHDEIDFQKNVIHIRRQLIYRDYGDGYRFHVEPPKSNSGIRDVPLTASARESLIEQKKLDLVLGRRSKEKPIDNMTGFVFINSKGTPTLPFNFNNMLRNVINAYNKKEILEAKEEHREPVLLPHISAHILRHTACTRMAEAGIDPKVLQIVMGHADISTTMNIYNHVDAQRIQNEMKKLKNIM